MSEHHCIICGARATAEMQIQRMREALEWYADETDHDDCCNDYGNRAKYALKRLEEAEQYGWRKPPKQAA